VDARTGPDYWSDPATAAAWLTPVEAWQSPVATMEEPMFWRLAGDVSGARVLDVGCGTGALAAAALERGAAAYHGIEPSAPLLAHAIPRDRATFAQGAIESLEPGHDRFDLVVARLVLHYVADLDDAIRRLAAALARPGVLVFTVEHPIVTSHESPLSRDEQGFRTRWVVDDYFAAGPRRVDWFSGPVVKHHRPLEDHVRTLRRHGFALAAIEEGRPCEALFDGHADEHRRRLRIPLFLGIRAELPSFAARQGGR
jgi:SAM-dependent methyltransferase